MDRCCGLCCEGRGAATAAPCSIIKSSQACRTTLRGERRGMSALLSSWTLLLRTCVHYYLPTYCNIRLLALLQLCRIVFPRSMITSRVNSINGQLWSRCPVLGAVRNACKRVPHWLVHHALSFFYPSLLISSLIMSSNNIKVICRCVFGRYICS